MKLLLLFALCLIFIAVIEAQNNRRGSTTKWPGADGGHETTTKKKIDDDDEDDYDYEEANRNVFYNFETDIDDAIKDGVIQREETRAGSQVTGSYTYSDGFFRHTVSYIADEGGYRVISDQSTPIGDGPIENPRGFANVQTRAHGYDSKYTVNGKDINLRKDLLAKAKKDVV